MEPVLDKFRNILNVKIKKEYYNNFSIFKQQYINNLNPLEDKEVLKILKCNYLMYGLVTNEMIEKKENNYVISENDDCKFLFKNPDLINLNQKISDPNFLFDKVNNILEQTTSFLLLVNEYYERLIAYDVIILKKLTELKLKNLSLYLQNFIVFNNIRIFINLVFFEYYQDMNYINNRLLQVKYDYFIIENDILKLNNNISLLTNKYCDSKTFVLKLDDKIVNFKVDKGDFDIINLIEIIEEKLDKLNNLEC
jgi:hypothetical protein